MRIGFFTNTYLPLMYGSTTSIENFRKGLEKLGHEVYIFAPRYKGYQHKGEKIILYPSVMYGYKVKYPLPFSWCPKIHKKASEIGLDIVHSHHPFSIGRDGLRISKKLDVPIVFTHHARYDDYSHYILPIIPGQIIRYYIRTTVKRFANECDKVIAPSESIKKYVKKRGITSPVDVVSTGIEWERFQKGKCDKVRERYSISEDEKILLYLGRIDKEKDLIFLSDAVFSLMRKNKTINLMFVGEGSLIGEIKASALKYDVRDRVIFTGLIDQSEVQNYYAAADMFVHASRTETQGMTITEAMASGLPIVAVEGTGVSDQIENGRTGILTPFNKKIFARQIQLLINDSEKRERLGSNARLQAKKMSYIKQAKILEGIYIEEIEKNRNKRFASQYQ
ncbi:MAG: glycosyltransferase [Patescibacteria group bacterium]|nr:glycosyltransferase [Patescibacteria group bacterium]